MNKKLIITYATAVLLVFPLIGFAQFLPPPGIFQGNILQLVIGVAQVALTILWIVAAAFVIIMTVVAGFKFMNAQGDPGKVAEARQAVIWVVVGAAVIVLAWSVLAVIRVQIGV